MVKKKMWKSRKKIFATLLPLYIGFAPEIALRKKADSRC